jgi:hypothetical protein
MELTMDVLNTLKAELDARVLKTLMDNPALTHKQVAALHGVGRGYVQYLCVKNGMLRKRGRKPVALARLDGK